MRNNNLFILALCLKHNNDLKLVYHSLEKKETLSDDEYNCAVNFTGNFITVFDANYPRKLKETPYAPFVLYYEGDVSLLSKIGDGKNDLIFLHGPNSFGIPVDKLVTITSDHHVSIGGNLRIWFNDDSKNMSRFFIAANICSTLVCTKEISRGSWFNVVASIGLSKGAEIYVVPTTHPSSNNELIKDGAYLLDCFEDLDRY